jgi:hypothetical protein
MIAWVRVPWHGCRVECGGTVSLFSPFFRFLASSIAGARRKIWVRSVTGTPFLISPQQKPFFAVLASAGKGWP